LDKALKEMIAGELAVARQKIVAAEDLLKLGHYSDAASRAYYAVFHSVRAMLQSEGLNAESHSGLITLFGLHFVKTGKWPRKFSKYLQNLKDDREEGDYGVYSTLDEEDARTAIREAKEFLTETETQLKSCLE
jgi:uncharacterized protein (UPF0332 family)